MSTCERGDCPREARAALSTARPQRDNVVTRVWWDDRAHAVPKKAERLCKEHTLDTLTALGVTLIDNDEEG